MLGNKTQNKNTTLPYKRFLLAKANVTQYDLNYFKSGIQEFAEHIYTSGNVFSHVHRYKLTYVPSLESSHLTCFILLFLFS